MWDAVTAAETEYDAAADAKAYRESAASVFLAAMKELEASDVNPIDAKIHIYLEKGWKFRVVDANGMKLSRDGMSPIPSINQRFSAAIKFKKKGGVFAAMATWEDVVKACSDEDPDAELKALFKAFMKKANDAQKADLLAFFA